MLCVFYHNKNNTNEIEIKRDYHVPTMDICVLSYVFQISLILKKKNAIIQRIPPFSLPQTFLLFFFLIRYRYYPKVWVHYFYAFKNTFTTVNVLIPKTTRNTSVVVCKLWKSVRCLNTMMAERTQNRIWACSR